MLYDLTEENFILFAMKNYDNPSCKGLSEFKNDLKRFSYLKKLFKKFKPGSLIKERLILNHIVVLNNLFGNSCVSMLFFKIDEKSWPQLKSFLLYLNLMPPDNMLIEHDVIVLESLGKI